MRAIAIEWAYGLKLPVQINGVPQDDGSDLTPLSAAFVRKLRVRVRK
jgi:hypothetical protein